MLFALVLFFAAASTRLGSLRVQRILIGVAIIFLVIAIAVSTTSDQLLIELTAQVPAISDHLPPGIECAVTAHPPAIRKKD